MAVKRLPSTGATQLVQNFADAQSGPPDVPAHIQLPQGALPFWYVIVSARSRSDWSPFQLSLAAQLARTQYEIEDRQKQLDREGVTRVTERGTPVLNPLVATLDALVRRQLALVRSLQLAGVGDPRGQAQRDKAFQDATRAHNSVSGEKADDEMSLLA